MCIIYDFRENINKEEVKSSIKILKKGKILVVPTDTVYGICSDATNEKAVEKIFRIKNRDKNNPLNILVSSIDMAKKYTKNFNKIAETLANKFWPGALTMVFEKNDLIPKIVTANKETIGVRIPDNEVTLNIINELNLPIACPSANISGRPSGTVIEDIKSDFKDNVDIYIDCGPSKIGIESTIVKINENSVEILRQGKITKEEINALGIKVKECKIKKENKKRDHYKIKTPSILIYNEDLVRKHGKIKSFISRNTQRSIALLGFDEDLKNIEENINLKMYSLGSINNLDYAMKNIYNILRKIENANYDVLIVIGIKEQDKNSSIINIFNQVCDKTF